MLAAIVMQVCDQYRLQKLQQNTYWTRISKLVPRRAAISITHFPYAILISSVISSVISCVFWMSLVIVQSGARRLRDD